MNHQRAFFALFFFLHGCHFGFAQISCIDNGNFTRNSPYAVNLNRTIQALHENVPATGFYNASEGQGGDRANAVVLCRGDVQLHECRDCILEASDQLSRLCPLMKVAVRWDERCMLRYSNNTLLGGPTTNPTWYWRNQNNATSPDQFEEDVTGLVNQLSGDAASGGSLRKVAAANVTGPDFQRIFGMLQCTPDLSQADCSSCLIQAISKIPNRCDGRRGCRVIFPSCNLRFEIYPFYNETRIRELEPVVVSPPAPVLVPVGDPPSRKSGGIKSTTVIIIVVSIVLSLGLAVLAIICLRKRRTQKHMKVADLEKEEEISTEESLQYAFSTIKAATDDFSDYNKLGEGGFGSVYKGKLPNGLEIAVKRLSRNSGQGNIEFKNEVLLLAKLQHRNLVRLLGFAIQGLEKLLIYELVQNGSLDQFIFDQENTSYLDWDRRYKIIGGIVKGILYLHEDSRLKIIHRDLKASNILLDREMNPKIADFGMARLFGQDETQANTSRVVGTYGYMPPEYILHGQFSVKSDVFSFGVILLEMISGRNNNNFRSGESTQDLLSFTWKNWRDGRVVNLVDPSLMSSLGSDSMREMVRCIHIGLLCVQENASDRPTMSSIVVMLSSSSISLALPSKPAFHFSSVHAPDISLPAGKSDHSYYKDDSMTELYPR